MNWNQPICERCWFMENPARRPVQFTGGMGGEYVARCCMCGDPTVAGIFIRRHPDECKFPAA